MGPQLPLYYQIKVDLKKKILEGNYKVSGLLPSEKELVAMYNVSRLTAREAIKGLVSEGLAEKIQGKGTYVAEPKISHRVGSLYSGGEEALLQHFELKTKVLKNKKIKPDNDIRKKLALKGDEEVLFLERLRYAGVTPFALIKCYLPYEYVKDMELLDFTDKSLYRTMEDEYRLQLKDALEIIEAVAVDDRSAKLLMIKPGTPILLNQRVTYLIDDTLIEYEQVLYRSDIFKYRNKLIGRGQGRLI